MIIGEGADENASFSDQVAKIDPAAQFGRAVNDSFIPVYPKNLVAFDF